MILSKQEKEAVKMGLPVFTVRITHSLSGKRSNRFTWHRFNDSLLMNTTICVIRHPRAWIV